MPVIAQVTIGAAATQISPLNINVQTLVIQDNAAHNIRVGDSTVTSTNGIAASLSGGSFNLTLNFPRGTILSQWYVAGTQGDVVDFLYEP